MFVRIQQIVISASLILFLMGYGKSLCAQSSAENSDTYLSWSQAMGRHAPLAAFSFASGAMTAALFAIREYSPANQTGEAFGSRRDINTAMGISLFTMAMSGGAFFYYAHKTHESGEIMAEEPGQMPNISLMSPIPVKTGLNHELFRFVIEVPFRAP